MVVLCCVGILFFLLVVVIWFFCSSMLNNMKNVGFSWGDSYECGFFSSVLNLNCFSFTYFYLLIIFVIFDLEISLLLNMPANGLLFCNFFYYYMFLVLLFGGYIVELVNGYARWVY
uniref:NADH-ubiquinone oxidoreductase chain 3 n=1 Tax=Taenia tianguangfui TaxID=1548223 RepID=A0A8K1QZE6_9CEST|nr:NADH dehydrogenase subunit 3 [Taenia tianguangfui]